LRIKNYTSFSDDKIREVIQFVKPNNLPTSNFDVRVTNTRNKYCGVFYEGGGYAKKGVGSDPNRPLIIARVSAEEKDFPLIEDHSPRRRVDLYYEKYDENKGIWKTWHSSRHLAISKAYTARRSKENRAKGKPCEWKKRTGGYIDSLTLSREEALVHVLAHEFRHFWQTNHPGKRGKVWRARGKSSEKDSDAYAIKKHRMWRKIHNPKDAMQIDTLNWQLIENDSFTAVTRPFEKLGYSGYLCTQFRRQVC
jgi:hypothetical protein